MIKARRGTAGVHFPAQVSCPCRSQVNVRSLGWDGVPAKAQTILKARTQARPATGCSTGRLRVQQLLQLSHQEQRCEEKQNGNRRIKNSRRQEMTGV